MTAQEATPETLGLTGEGAVACKEHPLAFFHLLVVRVTGRPAQDGLIGSLWSRS